MARRWSLLCLLVLAAALPAADKKKKAPKPPDLQVVEAVARRDGEQMVLDGRVRNSGERTLEGVVLIIDFLSDDRIPVTTRRGPIEEEVLAPGKEAIYRLALNSPPRAVRYRIEAMDRNQRDLRVAGGGPFTIE